MCWHKWTKWELPEIYDGIYSQIRKCEKCGRVVQRDCDE